MVKILHVVNDLKKNGTETFIMNMFRNIDRRKYTFDFLVHSNDKSGFYNEIIELGGKIHVLPSRRENFLKYHKHLNSFFSIFSNEYNAVHMHSMSLTTLAPLYYAKKYNIKTRIFHIHASYCQGFHNIFLHKINKLRLFNVANYYFSCSHPASKWGYSGTSCFKNSLIIPNGINLEKFRFNKDARDKIRKSLNVNQDDFMIIHIGTFNSIKNHKFLIDIFSELKKYKHKKNLKLVCVGNGPLHNSIIEYSKYKNVDKKTLFLGKRDDITDLLSSADLMLMPSLHEGLGIALIEAQASGLPVIASTGVPEEVKFTDQFYFIPLENQSAWLNKVLDIIKMNYTCRDIKKLSHRYDIKETLRIVTKIYDI